MAGRHAARLIGRLSAVQRWLANRERGRRSGAYSERCLSAFHREADHLSVTLGIVIGFVGMRICASADGCRSTWETSGRRELLVFDDHPRSCSAPRSVRMRTGLRFQPRLPQRSAASAGSIVKLRNWNPSSRESAPTGPALSTMISTRFSPPSCNKVRAIR
jgi:hypothetical protein